MEIGAAIVIFIMLFGMIWYLSKRTQSKDDINLFNNIKKSAEYGDVIAQFKLAGFYYEGKVVPRDDAEAAKWYRKAAEQGHLEAQFIIGSLHEKGEGVARDDHEAYRWISMAAQQGYARARVVLESDKWMAYTGSSEGGAFAEEDVKTEVSRDQLDAYLRKAEEGDVDSQYNLGIIYYHGEGVPRNFEEALAWFLKAAGQDDAEAQYNLGFMFGRGEGVKRSQEQSIEWFRRAADKGHTGAREILEKMARKADS